MDSTYLVHFAYDSYLNKDVEVILSKRVESHTFRNVEDWAYDNTPEGYVLQSIEKVYGTPSNLDMYGDPDATV
jgi:hypothetical protein